MIKRLVSFIVAVGLFLLSVVTAYGDGETPSSWRDTLEYYDTASPPVYTSSSVAPLAVSSDFVYNNVGNMEDYVDWTTVQAYNGLDYLTEFGWEFRAYGKEPSGSPPSGLAWDNEVAMEGYESFSSSSSTKYVTTSVRYIRFTLDAPAISLKGDTVYRFRGSFNSGTNSFPDIFAGGMSGIDMTRLISSRDSEILASSYALKGDTLSFDIILTSPSASFTPNLFFFYNAAVQTSKNIQFTGDLQSFSVEQIEPPVRDAMYWLEKIYKAIVGGSDEGGNSDPVIDSNLQQGNQAQDQLDQFDQQISGQFDSSFGEIQNNVTGFVFPVQALSAMVWITEKWGIAWDSLGDVQSVFYFVMITGLALLFIGRGPMAMVRMSNKRDSKPVDPVKKGGGG